MAASDTGSPTSIPTSVPTATRDAPTSPYQCHSKEPFPAPAERRRADSPVVITAQVRAIAPT